MKLAAAITLWLAVLAFGYLAWCAVRGFDASLCEAVGGCEWRRA